MKRRVDAARTKIGEMAEVQDLAGSLQVMLDLFVEGKIDGLFVAYNRFVNTMIQEPRLQRLLPLVVKESERDVVGRRWDYLYEPDPVEILDKLLRRYVESMLYQAVVENISCEQAARMVAMKSATDNAGDLIEELQLVYNKARQAIITQEISEIVVGSEAL